MMVPANTAPWIHNYFVAQSFAESLKLTQQLSLIFKPSTKCQIRI